MKLLNSSPQNYRNRGTLPSSSAPSRQQQTSFLPKNSINNNESYPSDKTNVSFKGGLSFMDRVAQSNFTKNSIFYAQKNASVFEALVALGITCGIRPLTILATPKMDKRDKQYAAAQSIASGITGFVVAKATVDPFLKPAQNLCDKVNLGKLIHLNSNRALYEQIKDKPFGEAMEHLQSIVKKTSNHYEGRISKIEERMATTNDDVLYSKAKKVIKNIDNRKIAKLAKIFNLPRELGNMAVPNAIMDVKPFDKAGNIKGEFKGLTFEQVVNKADDYLTKQNLQYLKRTKAFDTFKFLTASYGVKLVTTPLLAALTIGGISPIMKHLFPKSAKGNTPIKNAMNFSTSQLRTMGINKNVFKNFTGNKVG